MSMRAMSLRPTGWVVMAAAVAYPAAGWAQQAQRTPRTLQASQPAASETPAQSTVSGSRDTAPLVFDGVAVIDVEQGKVRSAQRVVIAGTRIQAMGPASKISLPAGAQVIDARGQYLIPGLWDMRTHEQISFVDGTLPYDFILPLFLANGIMGIRGGLSVNIKPPEPWNPQGEWGAAAPLLGSPVQPPHRLVGFQWSYTPENMLDAARLARKAKAAGTTLLELGSPPTFAKAKLARDVGFIYGGPVDDPRREIPGTVSLEAASDSGLQIIDHLSLAGGLDTLCWGDARSLDLCQPMAARLRRNKTWLVPTLIGLFADKDSVVLKAAPRARAVFRRYRSQVRKFLLTGELADHWLRDSAGGKASTAAGDAGKAGALALLRQADMPLLMGTDGVEWRTVPGFALQAELAMSVAEGLTPLEALQAATLNPAKLLQATDSLGTVAPGKLADLVLLGANPLEDITNTTTIRAVVANGHYYDRQALDTVLAAVQGVARKKGFTGMLP